MPADIEHPQAKDYRKDLVDQLRIVENDVFARIEKLILNRTVAAVRRSRRRTGAKITKLISTTSRATTGSRSAWRTRTRPATSRR